MNNDAYSEEFKRQKRIMGRERAIHALLYTSFNDETRLAFVKAQRDPCDLAQTINARRAS